MYIYCESKIKCSMNNTLIKSILEKIRKKHNTVKTLNQVHKVGL